MNVLVINLQHQYFNQIIKLVEDGHTVYDSRILKNEYFEDYLHTIGVKELRINKPKRERVTQWINDLKIDMIINGNPKYAWIQDEYPDRIYIGASKEAADVELDKHQTKMDMESIGLMTPPSWDGVSDPVVVKPLQKEYRTFIINQDDRPKLPFKDYYQEQFINKLYEVNVYFLINHGQYTITHSHRVDGEQHNKGLLYRPWLLNSVISSVPEPYHQETVQRAHVILNWLKEKGGTYEGHITFLVDLEDNVMVSEINTRPGIYNSLLYDNDWMDQYDNLSITHPTKKTIINSTHPYGLAHWDPDVYIPAGLMYGRKDDQWYIQFGAVIVQDNIDRLDSYVNDHPYLVTIKGI